MLIHSRMLAAAIVAGATCLFVLPKGSAQQATIAPAKRAASAASTNRNVQVQFPRTVTTADGGGGYTTVYAEEHVNPAAAEMSLEMQQLHAAEVEAANEAQAHVSALKNASESDREALKAAIRDALVRQFDAQQKRRSEEIASIEERLGKLKETLQKRGAAKDAIVGKRLDQLLGIKDDLAWEETRPVPQRFQNVRDYPYTVSPPSFTPARVPNALVPAIAPQPTTPAAPSPWPVPAPPAASPAAPAPPSPAPAPGRQDSGFGSGIGPAPPSPAPAPGRQDSGFGSGIGPAPGAAPAPAAPAPPLAAPPPR
jgi:hypothetical protein